MEMQERDASVQRSVVNALKASYFQSGCLSLDKWGPFWPLLPASFQEDLRWENWLCQVLGWVEAGLIGRHLI